MDNPEPMTVDELRRAAAWLRTLPPAPWEAVELDDVALNGPHAWDPDLDPGPEGKAAHERAEARRAQQAVWRGLVDADGQPLVGEPLSGRRAPASVAQPIWRFLADTPTLLADLLNTCRAWFPNDRTTDPSPSASPTSAVLPAASDVPAETLTAAAEAAWECVPTSQSFSSLPRSQRAEWELRIGTAIDHVWEALGDG